MSTDTPSAAPDGEPEKQKPTPPVEHQFKPGQSGNPKGRPPNAGRSINEKINDLAAAELSRSQLRRIVDDPEQPAVTVAAARELLMMIEPGDLADFEDVMAGKETLAEARARGLNTTVIKKVKRRSKRLDYVSGGRDGDTVEIEFECDIELRDKAGEHIDRVMDRTDGRPTQAVRVEARVENTSTTLPTEIALSADVALALINLEEQLRNAGRASELPDPE